MEAQVWTLITLLTATLVGTVFYLGNRIDGLGARLEARIDAQTSRIDALYIQGESHVQSFAGLQLVLDRHGDRLGSIEGTLDRHGDRLGSIEAAVFQQGRDLAEQIYGLATKLDEHLRRHAS